MRISTLFVCLTCVWVELSQAAPIVKPFHPEVTIFKAKPSDSIEIIASQVNFNATYNSSKEAFNPIHIPFKVKSVNDTPLNYRITLQVSEHYCKNENGSLEPLGGKVTTFLGKENFPLVSSGLPGAEGYRFDQKVEGSHTLSMLFEDGSLPQLSSVQFCYGFLGIIAGVEV
ncbi:hypothetical protein [Photobacterium damselae]|uniref:hypothetical protein n=1 Tax=Photobacterium damselae TaxID=38293 RepID=UPI0030F4294B